MVGIFHSLQSHYCAKLSSSFHIPIITIPSFIEAMLVCVLLVLVRSEKMESGCKKWEMEKGEAYLSGHLPSPDHNYLHTVLVYSVYVGKDLSTMKFSLAAIALLKSVAAVVPSSWEGNMTNQMVRRSVVSSDDF